MFSVNGMSHCRLFESLSEKLKKPVLYRMMSALESGLTSCPWGADGRLSQ